MKQELSSLDLHFLVKEFKVVEEGKVDKIYQWNKQQFIIRFFTKNGKKNLRIDLPKKVFFTEKKYAGPIKPLGYCEFLRKYLTNTKVKSIKQKGFERILEIEFESNKYGDLLLIIELIKPGNIILVKDGIILNSLERQKFKDRSIQPKQKYEFPPERINVKEKISNDFLEKSTKSIVKAIATDFGFGGVYAEELLKRINLDKNTLAKDINMEEIDNGIKKLFNEKITAFQTEKEVFPFKMSLKKGDKKFNSFNEAIDEITPEIKKEEIIDEEVDKQELMIRMQKKRLKELETKLKETEKIGEYIYEKYPEFEKLLEKINALMKTHSFKEIKLILKENKHFKELNEKEKKIILEF